MTSDDTHKRTVRSFVRRSGRQTPAQQRAMRELWPAFGIEFDAQRLDFESIFGRAADRVLEIGFGNGETLVAMAAEHPHLDFLGIEVHKPGVGHCLLRARDAGVTNLRIVNHDAVEVLKHQVADASLARVNLLFPDPWPKKRHHKRRIVQPGFVAAVAAKLRRDGRFYIATDWPEYAEHIDEVMAQAADFKRETVRDHEGDAPLDRPRTKFEARGLKMGHRIRDWCFVRT